MLAGPLAWCGLLWAAVHPSLALVFVVPFMPLSIDAPHADDDDDDQGFEGLLKQSPAGGHRLSVTNLAYHEDHLKHADPEGHAASHVSPLHDFEESVKGFVDFGVRRPAS